MERFALEPLARAVGVTLLSPDEPTCGRLDVGARELSLRLGIPHRTVLRWRAEGIPRHSYVRRLGRTVDLPDHLACTAAGVHPSAVWPEWVAEPEAA